MLLKEKLKKLPEAPGIYQMLDKKGNIIYIGKSKCLKKRVQSYFVASPVWDKAKEMSRFIEDIKIVVTDTHLEAMLLECEMIKELKPYFNTMMKNDQKYSYLTLEENYRRNPLKITAFCEGLSFGPFRSKGQIQDVIDTLRNLYPITKEQNKYKLFYISNGSVVLSEKAPVNTEDIRTEFVRRAALVKNAISLIRTEKELMDYRDVICAELSKNPDNVYIVDKLI